MGDHTALSPYRVLDLTTASGWLCGKLLADLGADVVKVEPPGGDPDRLAGADGTPTGPFAGDVVDPEGNLVWWALNRGKRSVELALDDPRFAALLASAHAVVESFGPGGLAARGLDPQRLLATHPHLVVTSISPFGLDGPYAGFRAPDLVLGALSGAVWLTGDIDRPPVRISSEQFLRGHGAAEAAAHTVAALHHAARTGQGQHIDVSIWATAIRTAMNATDTKLLEGHEFVRVGPGVAYQPDRPRQIYACADGHVTYMAGPGPLAGPSLLEIVAWAQADGIEVPPLLVDCDVVATTLPGLRRQGLDVAWVEQVEHLVAAVFATRTKAELYAHAIANVWLLAPVNTVADLHADSQLAARGYWIETERPDGAGTVTVPGAWARPSATPLRVDVRAPRRGEHTEAVLAELVDSAVGGGGPAVGGSRPGGDRTAGSPGDGIFAGLKVWDMSWVGVGPQTARYLGDHGATVVRLDSVRRADVLRAAPPFKGRPGINNSQFYADFNASKLGVGIDLATPAGREVAERLASWADVVVESFTPKTLRAFGLHYEALAARNPSLVMLSTCMQGQTGPRANYRGFGQLMASIAGMYEITGWPDRDPTMVYGAYTDFICQRFCATVLMAAVDHRHRTGEGQHLDVAQFEAALQFLGPELLDVAINGRVATRLGNRHPAMAPHGIYPCRRGPEDGREGERWVAIACEDDTQWAALVDRMGTPAWATDPALRTLEGRRAAEDRIDAELAAWTAAQDPAEVFRALQPTVAAAPVYAPGMLLDDPHLAHLGFFVELDHTVMGPVPYNGAQARLSGTAYGPRKAAPCVGEDTFEILTEFLGYDAEAVAELLAEGAIEIEVG